MIPNRVVWTAIAIVMAALVFVSFYSAINKLNFSEMMALAQVIFTILAFGAVLYTLYYASGQFRKAMAKPLIKVAFNKEGKQQADIIYKGGKVVKTLPSLWLINEGNAIARYFQISFIIPEKIVYIKVGAYITATYESLIKDNANYILSYTNEGRYTLFVNKPYPDPNLAFSAVIDAKKCVYFYKDRFEIKYRIYGDWAETQEGELKVNINRQ
jgi:hypothetical protein